MYDSALREKYLRFYDVNSDERTLVHIYYSPGLPARPLPTPENEDRRAEWSLLKYENMISTREAVRDDQIPFLSVYTGTEIFAEAFGCGVHFPRDNNPFALPLIHTAAEAARLKRPALDAPSLERTFRIAARLRKACPDGLLGLPDIQSPFDIAALIWEKSSFFIATLEEPEAVKDLCAMVEETLTGFLDQWFREFGTDYVAHYPDLFMRGGMTLSEDEAGSISPYLFRKFCLGGLSRLSERYGGIAIHCCANSERQWDNFARVPGLRLINLNQPDDVLWRGFHRFERVAAQMHMQKYGGTDIDFYTQEEMPKDAHVLLFASAATLDEAQRKRDTLRSLRGI